MMEAAALLACSAPAALFGSRIVDASVHAALLRACVAAVCCFLVTLVVIPNTAEYLARKGLKGRDMGRRGTPAEAVEVPSALGIVCGVVYLVFVIVTGLVGAKDNLGMLANYSAALLSICFMTLLGFADDVLDLPWRYKLILPTVAGLPLVATYRGVTTVLVPNILRSLLVVPGSTSLGVLGSVLEALRLVSVDTGAHGAIVDLGVWYLLYMLLLSIFATNAINIYAGINGLEAGQSLIIGLAVLTANAYELAAGAGPESPHFFSATLILPFLAVTAGLLYHNAFPARVFVGDTFCYFAGMTLACCAILGHFSKTLLLFLIPQIVNFLYSTPQLFKLYPCPRHRLPTYDAASDTMRVSTFTLTRRGADRKNVVTEHDNMTLINLLLRVTGPLHERTATNALLLLQAGCCAVGLALRYSLGPELATPHAAAT